MPNKAMEGDLVTEMIGDMQSRLYTRSGGSRERRLECVMVDFVRTVCKHHYVMAYFPDEMASALSRMVEAIPKRRWASAIPQTTLYREEDE